MSIPASSHRRVRFGEFELDLQTTELTRNGLKLTLQRQPFHVLAMLLEFPGELVTRDELKKRLWASDTFVDFDRSLNKAVNRLRELLGDSVDQPQYIETLPRLGYRFIAAVEAVPSRTGETQTKVNAKVGASESSIVASKRLLKLGAAAPAGDSPCRSRDLDRIARKAWTDTARSQD
jgi:DNA-binding winged helix-turn-helix (wHTH) protein